MRVFLTKAQTITRPSGAITTYAIGQNSEGEFYEVPEELGEKWVKEGVAGYATKDNVAVDEKPEPAHEPEPEPRQKHRRRSVVASDEEKES